MAAVIEFTTQPPCDVDTEPRVRADARSRSLTDVRPEVPFGQTGPRRRPEGRSAPASPRTVEPRRSLLVGFGWMLVVLAVLATVAVVRGLPGGDAGAGSGAGSVSTALPARSGDYVVVGPGDTLRSLALEYAPDADTAELVGSIAALNGGERAVEVGQVLALPLIDR